MLKSCCLLLIFWVSDEPCSKIKDQFTSYNQAIEAITSARWLVQESVDTSTSSWIRGASYYSCDGSTGYFILATDKTNYIFRGLPNSVWLGFKNAESFGSYYNDHIKGNYKLLLTNH